MFHVKHQGWAEDARRVGADLSISQLAELGQYEQLLKTVAVPRGIIAPGDATRLWNRHILDSLRGAAELPDHGRIADIGSGAGLPGIPLAIAYPAASFVLIEPRRARVAFLEAVAAELELSNVSVLGARAEGVRERFDAAVARAVSSPARTWELAAALLEPGGMLVYWAGARFDVTDVTGIGATYRLSTRAGLADGGPLVIMARQ
jgi:16S rRNA (guanine527-N7)-methyltransferase